MVKGHNISSYGRIKNDPKPGFNPWVRKIPWRREWLHTAVFLPGESMDRGT